MSKIDKEPYFDMWQSVLVVKPSSAAPKIAHVIPGKPFYQHKSCKGLVAVNETRIPPKVCPECGVDCVAEQKKIEAMEKDGIVIKDSSRPAKLLVARTFGNIFKKDDV